MAEYLQERAICKKCKVLESMEHILFECSEPGSSEVWDLLREACERAGLEWKRPSWGTTLGAACARFTKSDGSRATLSEKLWTILWTESAYLVWKLRCERVIQNEGKQFTGIEVRNRWYAAMNRRLTLDRRTAAMRLGKKGLNVEEVQGIWTPVVGNKEALPANWVVNSGVLVGIG